MNISASTIVSLIHFGAANSDFYSSSVVAATGKEKAQVPWKTLEEHLATYVEPKYLPPGLTKLRDPSRQTEADVMRVTDHWDRRLNSGEDHVFLFKAVRRGKTGGVVPASYSGRSLREEGGKMDLDVRGLHTSGADEEIDGDDTDHLVNGGGDLFSMGTPLTMEFAPFVHQMYQTNRPGYLSGLTSDLRYLRVAAFYEALQVRFLNQHHLFRRHY